MDDNLSFRIYTTASELPAEWNAIAGTNVFLNSSYLSVLQQSAPSNMICHFIGLFVNSELKGVALSQFLNLRVVESFGERDKRLKTKIRHFFFKGFSSNVLMIGNNMLTGQNAFSVASPLSTADGLNLMHEALREVQHRLAKNGYKVHLKIFKDFYTIDEPQFNIPKFDRYYRFSTQPNMVFNIWKSWKSFDDYSNSVTKKYRDQYKRARKKSEAVTKKKLSLDEIILHNTTINTLYMTVAKHAPFNTFYLPKDHFIIFKQLLQDKFLFYGYFAGNELIGFNTLIKNGTDIDTYFLGYDSDHQRDKMLYLNMLYDMIGYSINKGYKRIIFARTALEIKSSVGATPLEMFGYIEHCNPVLNFFMPRLFKYFEPEMSWQQRHPFKDLEQQASFALAESAHRGV